MTPAARLAIYIISGIVIGAVLIFLLWSFDPFGRRKAAEVRAVSAEQGESLAVETQQITERTFHTETVIREEGERVVETIEAAPGADTPVPPDVLGAWKSGINSLRGDAQAAPDQRTVQPARTVPTPVY